MNDILIAELRTRQEKERQRRIAKEIWLNSVPEDIEELRAGYAVMRRLLNRSRRIELEATAKGKERPVLISGWDTDPDGKPIEKYWFLEVAEVTEQDSSPTRDLPEDAFEYLEELETQNR